MGNDQWPEGIPDNFDAMFHTYGGVIANEIRRHNVVAAHFEDHFQSVCEKLMSAQVLTRFAERVQSDSNEPLPETMTSEDVCKLYGLSFKTWKQRLVDFHEGGVAPVKHLVKDSIKKLAFTFTVMGATAHGSIGDEGTFVIHKGSTALKRIVPTMTPGYVAMKKNLISTRKLVEKAGFLVFTESVTFKSASAAAGIVYGNTSNGRVLWKLPDGTLLRDVVCEESPSTVVVKMPTPISGNIRSKKAIFKPSDVLNALAPGHHPKFDTKAWPRRKVQPHHFQAYLLRAVRNHFSNACRTIMRRHKERPGDHFSNFKTPDGEYNENWADSLPDATALGAFRTVEAAHDLSNILVEEGDHSETSRACEMTRDQRGEISELLKSHTIIEAVNLAASLSRDQKQVLLSIAEA